MRPRYGWVIVAAFLLIGGVVAVRWGKADKVRIGDAGQEVFGLVYIAQDRGTFSQNGIEMEYRKYPLGKDALKDLLDDKIDLAMVYSIPVVTEISQGRELAILSTLHTSTEGMNLIGMRSKGISNSKDIKGKRIGLPMGTNAEFFLHVFLTNEGLKEDEITLVHVAPEKTLEALKSGEVDASVVWGSLISQAENQLGDQISMFGSDVYTEVSLLVARKEFVENKPEAAERVVRSLVEAKTYYEGNPMEAAAIVAAHVQNGKVNDVEDVLSRYEFRLKLDNLLLSVLGQELEWVNKKSGRGVERIDFSKYIYSDFLKQVSPGSVTIQ